MELISKKFTQVGSTLSTIQYSYDTTGNLVEMVYPTGRTVTYLRDANGRVSSITTKASTSASTQTVVNNINYLPFGPANSFAFGNGLSHTNSFDSDYRLTAIQVGGVLSRGFNYDPADNIININNLLASNKNQSFVYDALNRLTSALGIYGKLTYTYDDVGNRLSEISTLNSKTSTDIYSYEAISNRLKDVTTSGATPNLRSFIYDEAGNRIKDSQKQPGSTTVKETTYAYNNANRLTNADSKVSFTFNNTTTSAINGASAYRYNPLGQRVSKSNYGNIVELYHYDEAGQLVAVTNAAGNVQREYIYNGNQLVGFTNAGTLYYVHNDHLGTPQVVTNQTKQVVWMADYQPFGKVNLVTNTVELYSRFPGQYVDGETGNYYNYFRDYDPSIGRYIESDPIGLEGGINTYAYVDGNPVNYIDSEGLQAKGSIITPLLPIIVPGLVTKPTTKNPNYDPADPDTWAPTPIKPYSDSAVSKTKYRWVRCSMAETNECKTDCDMQGKSMKSCMSKVKSGPGIKEGQAIPEIGKLPDSISCDCNEEPTPCPDFQAPK